MGESIYLAGSEDVRSAANSMREAAQQMNHAAGSFQFALEQHQRFMDDWLIRFSDLLTNLQIGAQTNGNAS